jgi:hypothetical protein
VNAGVATESVTATRFVANVIDGEEREAQGGGTF